MQEPLELGPWIARPQPFEADFFGGQVWRLDLQQPEASAEVIEASLAEAVAAARSQGVRLISARVDTAGPTEALAAAGFNNIETLVTLKKTLDLAGGFFMPKAVRERKEGDDRPLVQLGHAAFTHDRFHADPKILDPIADALKGAWVENGLNGRADVTLVAEHEGRPVGFNLCLLRGEEAFIDLIAVERRHQGKGLGTALVQAAIARFTGEARCITVGTQASNTSSMKVYERCGFTKASEVLTFHWHP